MKLNINDTDSLFEYFFSENAFSYDKKNLLYLTGLRKTCLFKTFTYKKAVLQFCVCLGFNFMQPHVLQGAENSFGTLILDWICSQKYYFLMRLEEKKDIEIPLCLQAIVSKNLYVGKSLIFRIQTFWAYLAPERKKLQFKATILYLA